MAMNPDDAAAQNESAKLLILIPVYNDWIVLEMLLLELDRLFDAAQERARVLVVDDGSTIPRGDGLSRLKLRALSVTFLVLRRNVGHQRTIAIGLCYVEDRLDVPTVIVMDADGEDAPADVLRLLTAQRNNPTQIVFAERTKRSESIIFLVFYWLFKATHYLLIGRGVRVGNFSVIPRVRLESLVVVSELWNHYAASAFHSRQPLMMIPTVRGKRLHGHSKMNFVSLVIHGLSAISVYSEIVGVRALALSLLMTLVTMVGLIAVVYVRLFTSLPIPGWATSAFGLLAIVLIQSISLASFFCVVALSARNVSTILPKRDYAYFINRIEPIQAVP
jgi:polyisoprenyl-phosphate glycosyltransferase